MTKLTYSPYWLASEVSCYSPDSEASPGAKFLDNIQDAVNEIEDDELVADTTDERSSEWAHEIADQCVPVYTYPMWQTFVDLGAFNEDPEELGMTSDDMTRCGMTCLYIIGHRLAVRLIEIRKEELGVGTAEDDD